MIEVESIDERYTSFEASNILEFLWEKNTYWKKDAISASLILETYLNIKR
jgi:RNase H-fold protein (predicted Holliday junction resolvase)